MKLSKKRWNLGRQLWLLTLAMMLVLVVVEFFNNTMIRNLTGQLDEIGHTQLPAVRVMTLADMMHDGLRAVVYRSILGSYQKKSSEMEEARTEYKEFAKSIIDHLNEIHRTLSDEEIKKKISESLVLTHKYVEASEGVLLMAEKGKVDEALKLLPQFQEVYKEMEVKFDDLGNQIEKGASQSVVASEAASREARFWGLGIAFLGAAFGLALSFLINRKIVGQLSKTSMILSQGSREVGVAIAELSTASSDLASAAAQ